MTNLFSMITNSVIAKVVVKKKSGFVPILWPCFGLLFQLKEWACKNHANHCNVSITGDPYYRFLVCVNY